MRWPFRARRDVTLRADRELSAYLDGALEGRRLRDVERARELDPGLRERLRQLRKLSDVARADEPPADEQVFDRYFAAISGRLGQTQYSSSLHTRTSCIHGSPSVPLCTLRYQW